MYTSQIIIRIWKQKKLKSADKEARSILQNTAWVYKDHAIVKGTDVASFRARQTLNASLKDSKHNDLTCLFKEHKPS